MKIPVFYHIPKCGGTYVITKCLSIFRHQTNKISTIHIKNENEKIVFRCFISSKNPGRFTVKYQENCFDKYLEDILFIAVTGHGIPLSKASLKNIFAKHEFLILRNPFDRIQSLYNYVTSEASQHEATYKTISSSNFKEFISTKPDYEKNWVAKQFSLSDNCTREDIARCFKDIKIYDILNIEQAIIDCFYCCYPEIDCAKYNKAIVNGNINIYKPKKIHIGEIEDQYIKNFIKHQKIDYMIYDTYCVKSLHK